MCKDDVVPQGMMELVKRFLGTPKIADSSASSESVESVCFPVKNNLGQFLGMPNLGVVLVGACPTFKTSKRFLNAFCRCARSYFQITAVSKNLVLF